MALETKATMPSSSDLGLTVPESYTSTQQALETGPLSTVAPSDSHFSCNESSYVADQGGKVLDSVYQHAVSCSYYQQLPSMSQLTSGVTYTSGDVGQIPSYGYTPNASNIPNEVATHFAIVTPNTNGDKDPKCNMISTLPETLYIPPGQQTAVMIAESLGDHTGGISYTVVPSSNAAQQLDPVAYAIAEMEKASSPEVHQQPESEESIKEKVSEARAIMYEVTNKQIKRELDKEINEKVNFPSEIDDSLTNDPTAKDTSLSVFTNVKATLSKAVLETIPGTKCSFFSRLRKAFQVTLKNEDDGVSINGSFVQVLEAQRSLRQLLVNCGSSTEAIDDQRDCAVQCELDIFDQPRENTRWKNSGKHYQQRNLKVNISPKKIEASHENDGEELQKLLPLKPPLDVKVDQKSQKEPSDSSDLQTGNQSLLQTKTIGGRTLRKRKRPFNSSVTEKVSREIEAKTTPQNKEINNEVKHNVAEGTYNSGKANILKTVKVLAIVDTELADSQVGNSNEEVKEETSVTNVEKSSDIDPLETPLAFSVIADSDVFTWKQQTKAYEESTPFKFFCKSCSFKTKRESHFVKHMLIHEKRGKLHKCTLCDFSTLKLSHLRRHELAHSKIVFSCKQCTYKTDDKKLLLRHVKFRHKKKEEDVSAAELKRLSCSQCKYTTLRPYLFQRHMRVHADGGKSKMFECRLCNYKTSRKEHYTRHVNNVHTSRRPFLCDLCGKAFKRGDALRQHKDTHSEREHPFHCDRCSKGFRSHAHLIEHQASHSDLRSFLCELCGASFKTRSCQRKHVLTIHMNPRAHQCDQCEKRFNTNYALRRHMKLHFIETMKSENKLQDGEIIIQCSDNLIPSQLGEPHVQIIQNMLPQEQESILQSQIQMASISQGGDSQSQYLQSEDGTTLVYLTSNFNQYQIQQTPDDSGASNGGQKFI